MNQTGKLPRQIVSPMPENDDPVGLIMQAGMALKAALAIEKNSGDEARARVDACEREIELLKRRLASSDEELARAKKDHEEARHLAELQNARIKAEHEEARTRIAESSFSLVVARQKIADLERQAASLRDARPTESELRKAEKDAAAIELVEAKLQLALRQAEIEKSERDRQLQEMTREMQSRATVFEARLEQMRNEADQNKRRGDELAAAARSELAIERSRCQELAQRLETREGAFKAEQARLGAILRQAQSRGTALAARTEKAEAELARRTEQMKSLLAARDAYLKDLHAKYQEELVAFTDFAASLDREIAMLKGMPRAELTASLLQPLIDRRELFVGLLGEKKK